MSINLESILLQDLGLNITCVNPRYLGDVSRDAAYQFKLNFVKCCIDDDEAKSLFTKLKDQCEYYSSVDCKFREGINFNCIMNNFNTSKLIEYKVHFKLTITLLLMPMLY